jgi:phosphoglycolate phosphatase
MLLPYGDDRIDLAVTAYRAHYGESGMYLATVYPGVADALERLHRRGKRMFVATSKRAALAAAIVHRLGLAAWLHGVYGTEPDGSLDHKADLIAALMRAERLAADGVVMIGDRSHDIVGAKTNGVRAIGALWGYGSRAELEAAGADALLCHPPELADVMA